VGIDDVIIAPEQRTGRYEGLCRYFESSANARASSWVVVLRDPHTEAYLAHIVPSFRALLTLPEAPAIVAVDVPIGLLDSAVTGGRDCERRARQLLATRASSVFSSQTRPALAAFRAGLDHPAVSIANRGDVASAPGPSRQTFGILPKIADIDAALVPRGALRACELARAPWLPLTASSSARNGDSRPLMLKPKVGAEALRYLRFKQLPEVASPRTHRKPAGHSKSAEQLPGRPTPPESSSFE